MTPSQANELINHPTRRVLYVGESGVSESEGIVKQVEETELGNSTWQVYVVWNSRKRPGFESWYSPSQLVEKVAATGVALGRGRRMMRI